MLLKQQKHPSKPPHFFHQLILIPLLLFLSKIIQSFIPIPIPPSLITLLLLFLLLSTPPLNLPQLEKLPTTLTNNIPLLFLPPPISLLNSLPLITQAPFLIIPLIILST
ncbi:CidA/LrgA family protein, partial [Staphylococcus aureus]|uniref:CidA/LrgA family protein n=1 Tax=Staphylococcus aureus TaxID=1280 RepID=UPI00119D83E8